MTEPGQRRWCMRCGAEHAGAAALCDACLKQAGVSPGAGSDQVFVSATSVESPLAAERYLEVLRAASIPAMVRAGTPGVAATAGAFWEVLVPEPDRPRALDLLGKEMSREAAEQEQVALAAESEAAAAVLSEASAADEAKRLFGRRVAGWVMLVGAGATFLGLLLERWVADHAVRAYGVGFAITVLWDFLNGQALRRGSKRASLLALARVGIGGLLLVFGILVAGRLPLVFPVVGLALGFALMLVGLPTRNRALAGASIAALAAVATPVLVYALARRPAPSPPAAPVTQPVGRQDAEPTAPPDVEPSRPADVQTLTGEFWRSVEERGHPRKRSFCPDGRYFEHSTMVGLWAVEGGVVSLKRTDGKVATFPVRVLQGKDSCSAAGCDLELDGLRYGRDPTIGNCSAAP